MVVGYGISHTLTKPSKALSIDVLVKPASVLSTKDILGSDTKFFLLSLDLIKNLRNLISNRRSYP